MFLDLLFPKYCSGCRRLGSFVCERCAKRLPYVEKLVCFYCKRGSFMGITHPTCRRTYGVDVFISILRYDNLVKKFIKEVKYRMVREVWRELLCVVEPDLFHHLTALKRIHASYLIQSVPLTPTRIRTRGFNQSDEIAHMVSRLSGNPVISAVVRHTDHKHQAQIRDAKTRKSNVQHVFSPAVGVSLSGKQVVLVDDVVTSGATTQSVTKVLKSMGATTVVVLALAKG